MRMCCPPVELSLSKSLPRACIEARKAGQLVVSATDLDLAVSSEHVEGCHAP
jgi:hypothetical protein